MEIVRNLRGMNFSTESVEVLELARQEALRRGLYEFICTEDLAVGLLQNSRPDYWLSQYLSKYGRKGDLVKIARSFLSIFDSIPESDHPKPKIQEVQDLAPRTKRVIEIANSVAGANKRKLVSPNDMFAGLVIEGESLGASVLNTVSTKRGRERLGKVDFAGRSGYESGQIYIKTRMEAFNKYILGSGLDKFSNQIKDSNTENPLVTALYQSGLLNLNEQMLQEIARPVLDKLSAQIKGVKPKEIKRGSERVLKVRSELQNIEMFYRLASYFAGKLPQVWRDPQEIIRSFQDFQIQSIPLPQDLIRFGIVHPAVEVRTAAWETQTLTSQQMAIAGFFGIDSKDSEQTARARTMGYVSMPYIPIALENEFNLSTLAK